MSDSKKKVPKRRFEEFSNANDWELRKLGKYVNIKSGWSPSHFEITDKIGDLFIKVDDLNYSNRIQSDSNMKVNIHSKYQKMKKGSTLFPKRGAAIMTNKVRILGKDSYMDTNMMALEPDGIDAEFLYTFISRTGLYKIADTSTIPQINNKHIEPYEINIPENEEQQKIGTFFKQLDNTIALHQRKLEKIKALKTAYLSEMFPAEGESKPKRRFAGFTGDWEQRKLGEITLSYSGGTPLVSKSEYYGDDIPFIRSAEINSDSTELCLTKVGLKNSSAKLVKAGDILYALYGATSGETGISRINGAINQAILAIHPMKGYESQFLVQWLRYQKKKIISRYIQGGQGNLSSTIIKNLDIKLPSLKEQIKIGTFFLELDNTITLHQRKLKKLQNIKKAYLNEMFI
ncbi:restriction endonuclease subunit S [Listeria seeligeri]|uniref:restriction endonuclease subunit S n=1 Tax=Listeria seeligeri TaxID=1640 RepID=UPI001623C198|nr:restriction endonuclease subunit S [Listeria seeligeri]MBC1585706.1 restriction endonuclease subunit S [Listeria seeligeri]MBC1599772.1 restriction endonuclease subunit S [Listeria seeligeri]